AGRWVRRGPACHGLRSPACGLCVEGRETACGRQGSALWVAHEHVLEPQPLVVGQLNSGQRARAREIWDGRNGFSGRPFWFQAGPETARRKRMETNNDSRTA